jgi:bacillithiol system protein YtxJ
MKRLLMVDPAESEQWVYIDVVTQRSLSMAIAEELNVRHESPQLIMLLDGRVMAHGSHHRVSETTVEEWRKEVKN